MDTLGLNPYLLVSSLSLYGVLIQCSLLAVIAVILSARQPAARQLVFSTLMLYGFGLTLALLSLILSDGSTVEHIGILVMGLAGIRLTGAFLFRVLLPLVGAFPPSILEDLTVFACYVLWAMSRLSVAGMDFGSIITTSAVLTAVLAISLQDTLGNILGGTVLQLDNSIRVGDWITVNNVSGRVVDIRWRSTVVETRNWETVVLPNSVLMKNQFYILGRREGQPQQWRRWVRFSVEFGVEPQKVVNAVERALRNARIDHVAKTPAPNCVVMGIENSVVDYAVRYWLTDMAVDDPTDSAVRMRIYAALARDGIDFAFPEQNVHVIKETAKKHLKSRKAELDQRIKTLATIELFSSLADEELRELATHLRHAPFVSGEMITSQGATAHWLYLLVSGEAEIVYTDEHGRVERVATVHAGSEDSFIGEMGMLTGEKRRAGAVALTDVECYRLDKKGFEKIIQQRPEIAEEISQVIAARSLELDTRLQQMDSRAQQQAIADLRTELLRGIRRFFNLH